MSELCAVSKYEDLKNKIRNLTDTGHNIEAIDECYVLEKRLKDKNECLIDDFWFIYFVLSKNYKKVGNIKKSLSFAELSTIFIQNDAQRHCTYWSLAVSYTELGDRESIKKAIELYDKCIYYYSSNDDKTHKLLPYLISVISNKAILLKDKDKGLKEAFGALEIYNNYHLNDLGLLNGIYENIVKIYINHNDEINAYKYTKKIKDKT